MKYVWQRKKWPQLVWKGEQLLSFLSQARLAQGRLLSKVQPLEFKLTREAQADILTEETIQTAAIEGERLNRDSVRSSVARHLKLPTAGLPTPDRHVDGLVEVLLDATQHYDQPLTAGRIQSWQAALFPTGYSGLKRICTGQWRGPEYGMQVVSERRGREVIHFEAPPGAKVSQEMKRFLNWWKTSQAKEEGLLRAGLAHFYFVTIHPFEDGNGRIARALTDMALAQDEKNATHYYSLSSQIMEERNSYYAILETSQKRSVDVTEWLKWFLGCYVRAIGKAEQLIARVLVKAEFWRQHGQTTINERQRKVINRLLDAGKGGFTGGLTTRKYVTLAKVSRATAFREISDLLDKRMLRQNRAQGRSVSYDLRWPNNVE